MKNIILIVGNITFHHFEPNEVALFKTANENKALIHELYSVLLFDDEKQAYEAGDSAESYVVIPDFKGEIVFENEKDRMEAIKNVTSIIPIETIKEYSPSLADALKV